MHATSKLKLFLTRTLLEREEERRKKEEEDEEGGREGENERERDIQLHIVEGNHPNGFSRFVSLELYRHILLSFKLTSSFTDRAKNNYSNEKEC